MAIKKKLGKFGNRFLFEFVLEEAHDSIIQGFKKYLSSIRSEDVPSMVAKGKFPPLDHLDLSFIGDNIEYIEAISVLRLMEFIAEARPDIAKAIQRAETGAEYMVGLHRHIINKLKNSIGGKEFKPEDDTVLAHCDKCDKKWPVKKEEAGAITKCPFCGAGGGDEGQGSQPEEE